MGFSQIFITVRLFRAGKNGHNMKGSKYPSVDELRKNDYDDDCDDDYDDDDYRKQCYKPFRKIIEMSQRNGQANNDQNNHHEMESYMKIQNNNQNTNNGNNDNSDIIMKSASVALKSIQFNPSSNNKSNYSDKITGFGNFMMASLNEITDLGLVDDVIFEINSILYHAKKKVVKN